MADGDRVPPMSFDAIVEAALALDVYFGADGVFPAAKAGASRLAVVLGDNASGKSFLAKAIAGLCDRDRIEAIHLSMNKRTGGDHTSPTIRSLMFGSENRLSTGHISTNIVKKALSTAASREEPNVVILDEPGIGIAEAYHRAIGRFIAEQTAALPATTLGVMVITHDRKLVAGICDRMDPAIVRMNGYAPDLEDWLRNGPADQTIDDLFRTQEAGVRSMRAIAGILNGVRETPREDDRPEMGHG